MTFKVLINGEVDDMRVYMDIRTSSFTRLELLRKYSHKNKLQFKVELVDDG